MNPDQTSASATEAQTTTASKPANVTAFRQTHAFTPGAYEAEVVSAVVGPSPTGTQGLWLNFRVEGMGQFQGTLWLTPKAIGGTIDMLRRSFGVTGKEGLTKIAKEIQGKPCQIRLQAEKDLQGREWIRLRFVNPAGHKAVQASSEDLAALDALAAALEEPAEQKEGDF